MSDMKAESGSAAGRLIKIILPVCLIAAGLTGWYYFKIKESRIKRKPPQQQAIAVETMTMMLGDYQSSVKAMGTVKPDKEIVLKSKVSGEVVFVSPKFIQGGLIKKGETILIIEDSDYKIEVQKAVSALSKALSDLEIEKGSQKVAKEELRLINEVSQGAVKATDLALRKPQLVQAEAAVDSARADLEKARLNLSRTRVKVPFNSLILEKQVNLGSLVTSQGIVATLVDVNTFQVEAQVPPDRLGAILIDEKNGSRAIIRSQYSKQTWLGTAVRITGKMTSESRMAGVIILVPDPMGFKEKKKRTPLLLDDYVDVEIIGEVVRNVYSIPRTILRDDNTVWIYNAGFLEIKKVHLAWKSDGQAFIQSGDGSDIQSGDKIITTDIPAPINGMALQLVAGDRS